jgi:ribonuclease-3
MSFFLFKKRNPEDKELIVILAKIFGFKPNNLSIYKEALRHSSASSIKINGYYSNERLEFIGDAILGAITSDILYKKFPKANEGHLSVLRSTIINRKSLNNIAMDLNLSKLITFRQVSQHKAMKNIGGNSFEALVGAIYYDKGYNYCIKFIQKIIDVYFDLDNLIKQNTDFKSKLLQHSQKNKLGLKINTFENVEANEKNQHFLSEIFIDNLFISEGKGWTKKDAEQIASRKALDVIKKNNFPSPKGHYKE